MGGTGTAPAADGAGAPPAGPLRLAELVAALSLATDLGTGQSLEHALRTCLLSLELARRSGVAADRLSDVYYLALLRFVGCTADAADTAEMAGGDDIAFIRTMSPAWMGTPAEQVRAVVAGIGAGLPPARRLGRLAASLTDVGGAQRSITAHCEAAQLLSRRLGVLPAVTSALGLAFERWDGRGIPGDRAAEEVPAAVRVVVVARDTDLWVRRAGVEAAAEVARARSGHAYDPTVAAVVADHLEEVLDAVRSRDVWQATLDAEPSPRVRVPDTDLDRTLHAFADFADLKSPWLRGHAPGVARLAERAAEVAGLGQDERVRVRRAGLVHDLGRVGVAGGVWDRPGPLPLDAWERVRLHPYLTERILGRSPRLAPLARLAACHHERVDGSGYHRGARASELSPAERLLAAADARHAMTEDRPHRPAMPPSAADALLRRGAEAGRLAADAVEAVVEATGARPRRRSTTPAGLTEREVEVLRLIARGLSNRQVAARLGITPRTVGTHVEHVYTKTGVSTRAAAALFAMEHHLL